MESFIKRIFSIRSEDAFNEIALDVFRFQYENNRVYRQFVDLSQTEISKIEHWFEIPCLPIRFFKTHQIESVPTRAETPYFTSSGTTSQNTSKHYIADMSIYKTSLIESFRCLIGDPASYCFIALLPNYLEQKHSSLVYMVNELMRQGLYPESGFYKEVNQVLAEKIERLDQSGKKIILWGVTYALLDLLDLRGFHLKNTFIFETGGMKGRRKELTRKELHSILCAGFGVKHIGSEYGMTEMLSQAYAVREGIFFNPPWLKISVHDIHSPKTLCPIGKTGGISVFDLANLYSCSFIHTQDVGKLYEDGSFEVLGRFDNSDIRGCNLLYE